MALTHSHVDKEVKGETILSINQSAVSTDTPVTEQMTTDSTSSTWNEGKPFLVEVGFVCICKCAYLHIHVSYSQLRCQQFG